MSAFISEDFPTFDLPAKANSGSLLLGNDELIPHTGSSSAYFTYRLGASEAFFLYFASILLGYLIRDMLDIRRFRGRGDDIVLKLQLRAFLFKDTFLGDSDLLYLRP